MACSVSGWFANGYSPPLHTGVTDIVVPKAPKYGDPAATAVDPPSPPPAAKPPVAMRCPLACCGGPLRAVGVVAGGWCRAVVKLLEPKRDSAPDTELYDAVSVEKQSSAAALDVGISGCRPEPEIMPLPQLSLAVTECHEVDVLR